MVSTTRPGVFEQMTYLTVVSPAALATWAPRLHQYYKAHDDALRDALPEVEPNFQKSVFSCAAFNFGPIVCTQEHTDCTNCPFGFCAVQALGRFDHTKGGHIVLHDLKRVVEFPAGTTVLFPSAILRHSNTPVRYFETRASFTQFTPGNVLRFVDNGFMTQKALKQSTSCETFERKMDEKKDRWRKGLEMWSTLDELLESSQVAEQLGKRRREENARDEEEWVAGTAQRRKEKKARKKLEKQQRRQQGV